MLGRGEGVFERIADGFNIVATWILMVIGLILNWTDNWNLAMGKMIFAFKEFGIVAAAVIEKQILHFMNLLRIIAAVPEAIKAALKGGADAGIEVLKAVVVKEADIDKETKGKLEALNKMKKAFGFDADFKMDIGGELPTLKALFDKFGKFQPKTPLETLSPKLSESALEGSVEAAKIISANARNDLVDRNLAANERTAAAAEETAKNTKKKAPVANP